MQFDWKNFDSKSSFGLPTFTSSQTPSLSSTTLQSDQRENFKVVIRIRPPLPREIDPTFGFASIVYVSPDKKSLSIQEYLGAATNDIERE